MSKGPAFDAAKYRNNPKMIATYLNNALATDDPAFMLSSLAGATVSVIGARRRMGDGRRPR